MAVRRVSICAGALACLARSWAAAARSPSPFALEVAARLQPVLDELAEYYNTSFAVGVAGASDPAGFSVVAGNDVSGSKVTTDSVYPVGSATKLYTATAVLEAQERGLVDLDTPAVVYLDPFLQRTNGTTFSRLWGTDEVNNITVRQLLSMRSGIDDYDDAALHSFEDDPATFAIDQTPFDYLHRWAKKGILFPPGDGGAYSSINYVLAGLVVASVHNASTWLDLDQRSFLPAPLQKPLENLTFPLLGPCASFANVVHQFTANLTESSSQAWMNIAYEDLIDGSCLNGWTMGNLAATPQALAGALYNIFGTKPIAPILSSESIAQMMSFSPLTVGWSVGLEYGLGLMNNTMWPSPGLPVGFDVFLGHAGQDYGSGAPLHHYHPASDIAIAVALSSETGQNCSLSPVTANFGAASVVPCLVWNTVISVYTAGNVSIQCPGAPPGNEETKYVVQPKARQTALHCATEDNGICIGASTHLSQTECYAWKVLHAVTNGPAWKQCFDKWSDPCGCSLVQCDSSGLHVQQMHLASNGLFGPLPKGVVSQFVALQALHVNSNELFGNVPADLTMPELRLLNLSGNFFGGALPPLPFEQFSQGCELLSPSRSNEFSCPLPGSVFDLCDPRDVATCFDLSNLTSGECFAGMNSLYASPAVQASDAAFNAEAVALTNAAGAQSCGAVMTTRECNITVDWSQHQAVLRDAAAAVQSVDAAGSFCLLDEQFVGNMFAVGDVQYQISDGSSIAFPGACNATERNTIIAYQARPTQCLPRGLVNCAYQLSPNAATTCSMRG